MIISQQYVCKYLKLEFENIDIKYELKIKIMSKNTILRKRYNVYKG